MRVAASVGATAALLLSPATAAAQTALPLTGETLVTYPGAGGGGEPVRDIQGQCTRTVSLSGDAPGTGTSSFTYRAEGVATGPYPGTFEETGSFSIGPIDEEFIPGQFRGEVTHWQASFRIESAAGTVEGTKTITASPFNKGACYNYGTEPFDRPNDFAGQAGAQLTYEAIITLPDGTSYRDTGTSRVVMNFCNNQIGCGTSTSNQFTETYVSTGLELLPPPAPTSKADCKNGGWQNYPALGFKNQGDCVSFVATEGRNEPGQNEPGPSRRP